MRRIDNDTARRIFLDRHLLTGAPSAPELGGVLQHLGFVQVDSVNTLARAHDHILWSRRQAYRPAHLQTLIRRRQAFEHWTHDAAVLPMEHYPWWRLKFERDEAHITRRWAKSRRGFKDLCPEIIDRIGADGPITSADLVAEKGRGSTGWWDWHPGKTALEYLWMSGRLAICHRVGFRKHYDLVENVIPPEVLNQYRKDAEIIDWACAEALSRLGFATSGEIADFWAMVTKAEAKDWVTRAVAEGRVEEVEVETFDGQWRKSVLWPDLPEPRDPGGRVRILSPFDPALRDRKRAERLFGFHYRIEIFVPEAKRQYGYYVFPVLEGTRVIGRIDMKRDKDCVAVRAFWPERGVRMGRGRRDRLEAEIARIARLGGCDASRFEGDWIRD